MNDATGPDDPADATNDTSGADSAAHEGEETTTDDDPDEPAGATQDVPDEPDGVPFWAVRPGDVPALLAAYRSAVRQAGELAEAFAAVGLGDEVVEVTAGIGADGRPLVRGVLTLTGACRLAAYLDAGGAPPPGLAVRAGRPPWAA